MESGQTFPRPRGDESDGAPRLLGADGIAPRAYPSGEAKQSRRIREKRAVRPVPQTDTRSWVEHTEALE